MKTIFFKAMHMLALMFSQMTIASSFNEGRCVWGGLYICSNSIGGKIVHISSRALYILTLSWECHFPFWRLHWINIFENIVSQEVAKKCGFLVRRYKYDTLVAFSSLCPNQEQHNQKLEAKSRRPEIVFDDCCRNIIFLSGWPRYKTTSGC